MQPVVSPVGHGSSYNSFRGDDVRTDEATPLVRFPPPHHTPWAARTGLAFCALMALLALGTLISVYLLYVQSRADHVLPPVDTPLLFISRSEWCRQPEPQPSPTEIAAINSPSKHIIVVQTGTATCDNLVKCTELLQHIQNVNNGLVPFNFLVSSNGITFEALGWKKRSPMFTSLSAVVVAFIGEFSKNFPTGTQLEEAFTLFEASNAGGHVTRDFTIVGKVLKAQRVPTYLFASLHNLTQWDPVLSDEY